MKKLIKKFSQNIFPLVLTMLLLLSFVSVTVAEQSNIPLNTTNTILQANNSQQLSQNLSKEDNILLGNIMSFLNNVFKLDTSKYKIEGERVSKPQNDYDKAFDFYLSSVESKIDVHCDIKDNAIVWCKLYPTKSSPIYTTTTLDVLSSAKTTLIELNTFSSKSYLSSIQNMLNNVKKIESSTTSNAELTQIIEIREVLGEELVMMSWAPFANGLVQSQNTLSLHYDTRGHLVYFHNGLDMFTIGSFEAKISEQAAIQIAMEQVQTFSWTQGDEVVSNVEIRREHVNTSLSLQRRDGGTILYPYWDVWVPLAEVYPGGVTAFHVTIWADTGEVEYFTATGFYGDPNESGIINDPQQSSLDYRLVVTLTIVATIAVTAGYLFYKKKK
ncbi:MAG: hypothetical protein FWB84_07335 [Candidatus Bathyarchaeota archaeon]|uniref:hypothetical protein n=1 Tax=Candidatus Bathycorpusculum sp. TaxID=2994959 RepID=UPI00282219BF|nr:hypothetical protein [Candidatus Termiticorpusculum sp.]MCL2257313.1 hypothetical protein [Candidatus Termiticorpusculum sp.]MCL2291468.1 hypothetical protein [Candidatus Termiticorpusculum sp.]